MKFLANRKLATRISIIISAISLLGMRLLWLIVSSWVSTMVENNITNLGIFWKRFMVVHT